MTRDERTRTSQEQQSQRGPDWLRQQILLMPDARNTRNSGAGHTHQQRQLPQHRESCNKPHRRESHIATQIWSSEGHRQQDCLTDRPTDRHSLARHQKTARHTIILTVLQCKKLLLAITWALCMPASWTWQHRSSAAGIQAQAPQHQTASSNHTRPEARVPLLLNRQAYLCAKNLQRQTVW